MHLNALNTHLQLLAFYWRLNYTTRLKLKITTKITTKMKRFSNPKILVAALAFAIVGFASASVSAAEKELNEDSLRKELLKESEIDKLERDLIESGVLTPNNIVEINILDENDEVIYSVKVDKENPAKNLQLSRLLLKSDYLFSDLNKSYYKIF